MNHGRLPLLLTGLLFSFTAFAGPQEEQAWAMIKQGALVIDVRTTGEYADGHLPNALHIPYQGIVGQLQHLEVRKDRPVVLYCRSGGRAGVAEQALEQAGYSQIFNGGGLQALIENVPDDY